MKEGKEIEKIESEKSPEEIEEMMNEKALGVYRDNVAIRFTNESFLKDVFETKKEFRGGGMFLLEDYKDYDKHLTREKNSHELIPDKKANLKAIINNVYNYNLENFISKKDQSKMYRWGEFISGATDWTSSSSRKYAYHLEGIKSIKSKSEDKDDFYKNLREYVLEKFDNIDLDEDLKEFSDKVIADENFLKEPDNLRKYLHLRANLFKTPDKRKQEALKEGKDIFRMYNIGMLIDFDAIESSGHWARKNWCRFKEPEEINLKKHLKGIVSIIRDRVFEKKLIEEMEEVTKDNPELRVPVFDLDGNQIYPIRRKRKKIEEEIKEKDQSLEK